MSSVGEKCRCPSHGRWTCDFCIGHGEGYFEGQAEERRAHEETRVHVAALRGALEKIAALRTEDVWDSDVCKEAFTIAEKALVTT